MEFTNVKVETQVRIASRCSKLNLWQALWVHRKTIYYSHEPNPGMPEFVNTVVLEGRTCLSLFCLCWITTAGLSDGKRHDVTLTYLVRLCVCSYS